MKKLFALGLCVSPMLSQAAFEPLTELQEVVTNSTTIFEAVAGLAVVAIAFAFLVKFARKGAR